MTSAKPDPTRKLFLPPQVEFVQTIAVDINGYARGKMFPIEKLEDLLKDREEVISFLEVMGSNFEIPIKIQNIADINYRNNVMVLDKTTLRVSPWSKDSSLAMVFYDPYDVVTNTPFPFNPRLIAKNQIKELEKIGLKIFVGVENEFRLFDKATKKPWINELRFLDQFRQSTVALPYFKQLKKQLKSVDIEFDSCILEYGEGQVEVPLKIYGGIEGIDKVWLFKQISKHVADDMGLIASYMTVPLCHSIANGMHINHSLWKDTDQGLKNMMYNPSRNGELSEIGKYWLAGLLKHSRALCAFLLPTVNCYRRVGAASWSPNMISWNYRDRLVALRVKTSKDNEKTNYIENRIPSSACNIYLAIAAMIAAGLDGIKNKLELAKPGGGTHCESLPRSLFEALQALKENTILTNALGATFVDWYIQAKQETEVDTLKDVDIDIRTEQGIARELEKYFYL